MVGKILQTNYDYSYTENVNENNSHFEYGVEGKRKSLITEIMHTYSLKKSFMGFWFKIQIFRHSQFI